MSAENVLNEEKGNGVLADVISRLQSLTKYNASICGGCECCGTWVEHEVDNKYGNWIKVEDIENLVKELQANGL